MQSILKNYIFLQIPKQTILKKTLLFFISLFTSLLIQSQTSLPDIHLKNLEGETVSIQEASKDKLIVFDFWATWCVPCINELDTIADEYEDLQDDFGFELIAVSVDDARTKSRVKPMVNGKDWDYQILLDTNQEFKRAMNISSVPYVIIVKNGKVVYTHSGYSPGAEQELYEKFQSFK